MLSVKNKTALVTGGSQGLGRGIVSVLAAEGAAVHTIARDAGRLAALEHDLPGVQTQPGDITDPQVAAEALRMLRPDIVVLNAGARPANVPIHEQTWEQFARPWETDVKATFFFGKEALLLPLAPGSVVVIMSSGAALAGSPLSGGYAGAKRMLWIMAKYANGVAKQKGLDIRFQVIVPLQIIGGTGVGDAASSAYARAMDIERDAFLARFGAPMPPRQFGDHLVAVLDNPQYATGIAFGLKGDTGITVLEGEAA